MFSFSLTSLRFDLAANTAADLQLLRQGFDNKILASFEILNDNKYLFHIEGFYRKSSKSELVLGIGNNHKCVRRAPAAAGGGAAGAAGAVGGGGKGLNFSITAVSCYPAAARVKLILSTSQRFIPRAPPGGAELAFFAAFPGRSSDRLPAP
ncbi:hypothetical protein EVAR_24025_1 [Eumeta japonica]|uniref:Uncharacterized protein n=1 Tax=Eumeta variegata TaxID=151549 RepID=A0A4C1WC90_EUMVA|nr:hypothetical protein EVAR_24025_1 [Eumeta japonica]